MILVFLGEKGGTSKSTLSLGVGWEWSIQGKEIIILDADPAETCVEAGGYARAAGLSPPRTIGVGRAELLKDVPRYAKDYEHIIIDTPGGDEKKIKFIRDIQRAAMQNSDVVLIPVVPSGPDAWRARRTVPVVREAQRYWPKLKAAMVVTRTPPRSNDAEDAKQQLPSLGIPVFSSVTFNRTPWGRAMNAGLGVTKYEPHGRAADELRSVIKELEAFHRGSRA